jgi:alkylated DNA repair dioxygenase AlkB
VEQLGLLLTGATAPRTIAADDAGTIVYYPGVVTPDEAQRWFDELLATIDWRHERRPMYDRVVDVPRLVAHFRAGEPLPELVARMKTRVEERLGLSFGSVGFNRYRDGRDSVAMHHDHKDELEPRSPIALLSLGATRTMRLRTIATPRRTLAVALEPGSVLLMAGASQEYWEHGIPKTTEPVGERISVAFRRPAPRD